MHVIIIGRMDDRCHYPVRQFPIMKMESIYITKRRDMIGLSGEFLVAFYTRDEASSRL